MSNEMSKKVPTALLGIFIVVAIVLIVSISIQETNNETVIPTQPLNSQHGDTVGDKSASPYLSSKSYSGPFAILNDSYGVDDTVFFIGSEISQDTAAIAVEVEGASASLYLGDDNAPAGGEWPMAYMNSYGMTIAAGTSEVQRNILGERVLGMPKSK